MSDEPRRHDSPGRQAPLGVPTVVAYLVVVLSPLLIFLAFGLIIVFGSHAVPKENCGNFGCRTSESEQAAITAIIYGIPISVIGIIFGCGVLALLRLWKAYRRLPIVLQGLVPSAPIIAIAIRILFASY